MLHSDSKMTPVIRTSSYSHPSVFLPLSMCGICDLLLFGRIQQRWCYASFQTETLRNWQLPLPSLGISTLGETSTLEEVLTIQRPTMLWGSPRLAMWRKRHSAILVKLVQAPNMQLKMQSWKFQPQHMWHEENLREPAKSQTWGPNIWPYLIHLRHLHPFKLKLHSTVKQR